jgi:peptide/nickel transport system substrate-binding protein
MSNDRSILGGAAVALSIVFSCASPALAQKYGGTLRTTLREDAPSLSIHEESTVENVLVMCPVYNNLVFNDPLKAVEGPDTIVPDLAESWSWNPAGDAVTFQLHRGVTWHDGKPFTSNDVKQTFDIVRGAAQEKLRLNPRKSWYGNVREIATNGDHEVTFQLKRRQPALLMMLAGGYGPVYPAHVPARELRGTALGTGPFRLKQYDRGKMFLLVRNPEYFVKGRPYLDAISLPIIASLATRSAALETGQLDLAHPLDSPKPVRDAVHLVEPRIAFIQQGTTSNVNLMINATKPPFDNPKLREALSLALDRDAFIRAVYAGVGTPGGTFLPPPNGHWGLPKERLAQAPGFGDPEANREKARQILAALGYTAAKPLKIVMSTRTLDTYRGPALFVAGELKKVGVEASVEQLDPTMWYSRMARRDIAFATNVNANTVDDPDAVLYDYFFCGAQMNWYEYCDKSMEQRFDAQSMETDQAKRLDLVRAIDFDMTVAGAAPILAYRTFFFAHWPHVKNFVPSQSLFNRWRFQEIWLDK